MKFLFIDESAKQNRKKKELFALCGIIIDGKNLLNVEEALRSLKEKYALDNLKKSKGKEFKDKVDIVKDFRISLSKRKDVEEDGN